jgi:hypothetical protein
MQFKKMWPQTEGLYWAAAKDSNDLTREREVEPVYLRECETDDPSVPIVEMLGTDVMGFVEDFLWGDSIEVPKDERVPD